jgi:hypothetical protein
MIIVRITEVETTSMGDMAELTLERAIHPSIGMILIDEDSLTWEVTGMLHSSNRTTGDESSKLWTLQCKPVNTDKSIHTGIFKLMH